MLSLQLQSFTIVRNYLRTKIIEAPKVQTERWQGIDVRENKAAATYELRNVTFEVPLQGIVDLGHWRGDTAANVPWADDHFAERIGGEPLNPGVQWANWPWASSADKFRHQEKFNHTYMERLWPKYARMDNLANAGGKLPVQHSTRKVPSNRAIAPHHGIGYNYGDLQNLIDMLVAEPFTRQAYIPLFFPEDTGHGDGGRKPCTLGYQFMVRVEDGVPQLHIWYPMRSVDLIRHFPDDCYLAVRLLLWILDRCREQDPTHFWDGVIPGSYAMHMTSLHIFENDRRALGGT